MKTFLVAIALVLTSPAWAQGKPKPVAATQIDPCAPIGRTADGRFVYSLKCETLPASAAPSRAESGPVVGVQAPVPVEEEEDKGGLFKNPFPSIIKPTNIQQTQGVGPPGAGGR